MDLVMKNLLIKIRNFFFVIIVLLLLGGLFYRLYQDYQRRQYLKQEISKLLAREKQLEEEISNLEKIKSESNLKEKLEKQARLMLGLKKEGEEVVLVIPPKGTIPETSITSTTTENALETKSFFEALRDLWYNILKIFKAN